jgi:hypothetical protein
MKGKLTWLAPFLGLCILFWTVNSTVAAPIQYKQTMTKILEETQFQGWPEGYETWARYFNLLTCSQDGSRIAFRVETSIYPNLYVRTYAASPDGSGLIDLTGHFPPEIDPLYSARNYQLDDTGSRLFFRFPQGGSDFNFYYFNLATLDCNLAVLPAGGETYAIHYLDDYRPFSLTTIGGQTTLYFRHRWGWWEPESRYIQGIYSAPLGGYATKLMDINEVPGDQNMNLLGFQGSAANANQILFTWKDVNNPPGSALWKVAGPTRVPDEMHDLVWGGVNTHTISADGGKALFIYRDLPPTTSYLCLVNLASGIKTIIAQTNELESYFVPTMAPSGNYAFFSSPFNRRTRANLATGEQRDTLSYYFSPCTGDYLVSDITADDRYYFIGGKCGADLGLIHRVDMAPTDFSQTPNITAIEFTPPVLLSDGTTKVTVKATVSDAQGLQDVSWVKLQCLVDGLEKPEWLVYEPIYYNWTLYDDGTNGDQLAGDGVYTNDSIKAKLESNFYQQFTLPKDVGIRVVARDKDYNYVLADTTLRVGPLFASQESIQIKRGEITLIDIYGSGGPYTVNSSNPDVAVAMVVGTQVQITGGNPGTANLSIEDGNSNTTLVSIRVLSQAGPEIPLLLLE